LRLFKTWLLIVERFLHLHLFINPDFVPNFQVPPDSFVTTPPASEMPVASSPSQSQQLPFFAPPNNSYHVRSASAGSVGAVATSLAHVHVCSTSIDANSTSVTPSFTGTVTSNQSPKDTHFAATLSLLGAPADIFPPPAPSLAAAAPPEFFIPPASDMFEAAYAASSAGQKWHADMSLQAGTGVGEEMDVTGTGTGTGTSNSAANANANSTMPIPMPMSMPSTTEDRLGDSFFSVSPLVSSCACKIIGELENPFFYFTVIAFLFSLLHC
jgi:hypothetical protein